jgi:hypothetical protein
MDYKNSVKQEENYDGQEAKPYKNDPEILAMTNLIAVYQRNEILEFEKILVTRCWSIYIVNWMVEFLVCLDALFGLSIGLILISVISFSFFLFCLVLFDY